MATREHSVPRLAREIWFREDEREYLARNLSVVTVRAGDRTATTCDIKGGYRVGGFVTVKIQKQNGHFDIWHARAVVTAVEKKIISEVHTQDLIETTDKTSTFVMFINRMESLYGRRFISKDVVTFIRLEFNEVLMTANDLLRTGVLAIARMPRDNPTTLTAPHYTLPLIAHDYPAKTPVMWNAAYRAFELDTANVMVVGDPKQAKEILDVLRRDPAYIGGGAGVGWKDEVVHYLDELDPLAEVIGAVNFIMKTDKGRLKGYNTDGRGYARGLDEVFRQRGETLMGKKAAVLGAGGAGNAVAFALAQEKMRVVILNRTVEKAEVLAGSIARYFDFEADRAPRFGGEDRILDEVRDADIVVNVSTKGASGPLEYYSALAPARLPANEESLRENRERSADVLKVLPRHTIVSDIVLGMTLTPMLAMAKAAGLQIQDGVPMVVHQGVEAFWILHGAELGHHDITVRHVAEIMHRAATT